MTGVRTSLLRNLKRFIIRGSPVAAALSKQDSKDIPAPTAASRPRLARDLTAAGEEDNARRDGGDASLLSRSHTSPHPPKPCAAGETGEVNEARYRAHGGGSGGGGGGAGAGAGGGGGQGAAAAAAVGGPEQLSSGDGEEAVEEDASLPPCRPPSPRVPHEAVKIHEKKTVKPRHT